MTATVSGQGARVQVAAGAGISTPVAAGQARVAARLARQRLFVWFGLLLAAVVMGFPLLWMVLSSVKVDADLFAVPPVWVPRRLTWDHYGYAFKAAPFGRYFLNSLLTASAGTLLNVMACAMAGYTFAKFRFRGREPLFYALIGTMMVPFHVILIPLFLVARYMPLAGGNNLWGVGGTGLLNTYPGLLLPHLVPPFGIFLMRQFFLSIPDDLMEAGRIDGASEGRIFASIVLPLTKPALATLGIFSFSMIWDDFLWALVVTTEPLMRTVQLGLQVFQSQYTVAWGPLMAATTVVTLPLLAAFLLGQRHFIQGIASSGLKG